MKETRNQRSQLFIIYGYSFSLDKCINICCLYLIRETTGSPSIVLDDSSVTLNPYKYYRRSNRKGLGKVLTITRTLRRDCVWICITVTGVTLTVPLTIVSDLSTSRYKASSICKPLWLWILSNIPLYTIHWDIEIPFSYPSLTINTHNPWKLT